MCDTSLQRVANVYNKWLGHVDVFLRIRKLSPPAFTYIIDAKRCAEALDTLRGARDELYKIYFYELLRERERADTNAAL